MKVIKTIIAGSGNWAKLYSTILQEHPGFTITSIVSSSERRVRELIDIKIPVFSILDDALRIPSDLVIVVNKNSDHFTFAKKAITACKHVLVEKPAVIQSGQLETLCHLAKSERVRYLVNFQKRLGGVHRHLKELLDAEYQKSIVSFHSQVILPRGQGYYNDRNRSSGIAGGGALIYSGIHELDQLVNLFGEVYQIWGSTKTLSHDISVEDTASVNILFKNGIKGNLFVSTAKTNSAVSIMGKNHLTMTKLYSQKEEIEYDDSIIRRTYKSNSLLSWLYPEKMTSRILRFDRSGLKEVLEEVHSAINYPDQPSILDGVKTIDTHEAIFSFYNKVKKDA